MKLVLIIVLAGVGLLLLVEMGLRFLGFGNPLLYIADEQIGYLIAPNQQVKRFGNRIVINQYSMRGTNVSSQRSPSTVRLFLLGDSVANGGWWTDQAETVSERLREKLQAQLPRAATQTGTPQAVEVLNASANSWGPRNELAYLQKFGTFDAQVVVLLINTDDLFATAPTSVQVGRDRNYPDRQPPFALAEAVSRYLLKPVPIPELEVIQAEGGDRVGINLDAISKINALVRQNNGKLVLAMTPLVRELGASGPRDYEVKARQRLKDFAADETIPYMDFLPIFNQVGNFKSLYRDHIHLNPQGNQQVSQHLAEIVRSLL
ncbi:SGNH/GDSL hydrolase family protein [Oscillatoria sp. FACHB-1407]|uniref:SGNH/GDSL hydrolase family protein n=1 Tax=Oscillatoria sp. FACHB-1407 TaxID=2692847 RepID=UPI0016895DEC|nr:SGNH/GDSL hydrolase family protein [Oscillatoria sp. FACHB-1407]MBD2463965.1 SGNH/GDSL hydrolase family protein [Oscillatoria sp. FACHB-1407]